MVVVQEVGCKGVKGWGGRGQGVMGVGVVRVKGWWGSRG